MMAGNGPAASESFPYRSPVPICVRDRSLSQASPYITRMIAEQMLQLSHYVLDLRDGARLETGPSVDYIALPTPLDVQHITA